MKESSLQIQCVEYMTILAQKHNDLVFFSIPNEGIMMMLRMFKVPEKIIAAIVNHFKKMGLLPGFPDFCILYKGNAYFIEFKAEGKKPNEKQERIHKKLNDAYFTVTVIDDFENFRILIDGIIRNLKDC